MSGEDRPDDWEQRRQEALARDDYQCQRCGATRSELYVVHETPVSEGGTHELDNLETVCVDCRSVEDPRMQRLETAVEQQRRIRIGYQSSADDEVREVDPYGLGMHHGLQFLAGYDHGEDGVEAFRPNRIEWVELGDETFEVPDDWDTDEFLRERLGQGRQDREPFCFVATAAYGTPRADDLDVLRDFRDEVLKSHWWTRWLVPTYYRLSPPVARWIARSGWRRRAVRKGVVEPAVALVERLREG